MLLLFALTKTGLFEVMHGVGSAIPYYNTFRWWLFLRNYTMITWHESVDLKDGGLALTNLLCTWNRRALLLIELNLLLLLKVSHLLLNVINVIAFLDLFASCSIHWAHELSSGIISSELRVMSTQWLYILGSLRQIYRATCCPLLRLSHSCRNRLSILLLEAR